MDDSQIPLYIGIPLVILCLAASVFVVVIAMDIWKDRRR